MKALLPVPEPGFHLRIRHQPHLRVRWRRSFAHGYTCPEEQQYNYYPHWCAHYLIGSFWKSTYKSNVKKQKFSRLFPGVLSFMQENAIDAVIGRQEWLEPAAESTQKVL